MKGSSKKIAIGVAIVIAAIGIGSFSIIARSNKEPDEFNDTETSDINTVVDAFTINDDNSIDYTYTDEDILSVQENMNSFDYMGITKIETIAAYDLDGEVISNDTISSITTEIDLINKVDDTRNTIDYVGGDVLDLPIVDFESTFGFDYTLYDNAFDVVTILCETQGITTNLEDADKSDDLYEEYGQIIYTLNNDTGVIQNMLSEVDYDEIIDFGCTYGTYSDWYNSKPYIDYIITSISYEKDNTIYYKSTTYKMYLMKYEDTVWYDSVVMSNCSCGSDTDCSSGDECETDCEMNEGK